MQQNRQRISVIISLAAIFAVFSLALMTGCGKAPEKTADGRTILTFWHTYGDAEEAVLKEIITTWEAKNASWSVQALRLPFEGHKPKIRTALTVEQGPDMARVDWSYVCELARKNALADLEDFGFSKIRDNYVKAPLGTNFIDGKYRGFPDQTNCLCLFYNKQLFRDAGVDPEKPPKTWEEFVEIGKKITNPEKGIYAFGMDNTVWWTLPFFNSFGARLIADDGKTCLLDSKEAIDAVNFKASLYLNHKIEAGAWKAGSITPESGFINKKYAMIFMGPWNLPNFAKSDIDFGVTLIPAGPAGSSSNVGGTNVVIFNTSKHQQACYDFLTFFTAAEAQAKWCTKLNQIPVNIKAYDLVKFDNPHLMVFMEQMKTAVANPIVTQFDKLEDIVNPEMEAIYTGQKQTPDAMKSAARRVEKRILQK